MTECRSKRVGGSRHANGLVDGLDKRRLELDSALTGRDELQQSNGALWMTD